MSIARRRLLDRTVNIRDAAIFYVATEDTHAADQYLRALQQNGLARDTGERWPPAAGTHVHRLIERLPKPRRPGPAS